MGALAPLLSEALEFFDITYSPADSAGRFFVTSIKNRPDTYERIEVILRKTAHWEGGRDELNQFVRILREGGMRSLLLVTIFSSKRVRNYIQTHGNEVKKILNLIEKAPEEISIEDIFNSIPPHI